MREHIVVEQVAQLIGEGNQPKMQERERERGVDKGGCRRQCIERDKYTEYA